MQLVNTNELFNIGMTKANYFRHLFFGALVPLAMLLGSPDWLLNIPTAIFFVISTVLYPFSRLLYERIVGFIVGDNLFFTTVFIAIPCKIITIILCWFFAIFIAPFTLVFLYLQNKRNRK